MFFIMNDVLAFQEEPNVDEINAWLSLMEDKLNSLDGVPVEQLNDKHFEQCKVRFCRINRCLNSFFS